MTDRRTHGRARPPATQEVDDREDPDLWSAGRSDEPAPLMAPRPAVDAWLNSPGHRENLFQPDWRTVGISLLPGATLDDIEDGVVWVNHFGV